MALLISPWRCAVITCGVTFRRAFSDWPHELGSHFCLLPVEKLLYRFANVVQENTSLLHLTIRLHVTLEVLTLCPETSQSNLHQYWKSFSYEFAGVRKLRQASLVGPHGYAPPHATPAAAASQPMITGQWEFINQALMKRLSLQSLLASHHRCELNNVYWMKLNQKTHPRSTIFVFQLLASTHSTGLSLV